MNDIVDGLNKAAAFLDVAAGALRDGMADADSIALLLTDCYELVKNYSGLLYYDYVMEAKGS